MCNSDQLIITIEIITNTPTCYPSIFSITNSITDSMYSIKLFCNIILLGNNIVHSVLKSRNPVPNNQTIKKITTASPSPNRISLSYFILHFTGAYVVYISSIVGFSFSTQLHYLMELHPLAPYMFQTTFTI